jgi:pimeloyl-ACP methyl ester carboxylesterase
LLDHGKDVRILVRQNSPIEKSGTARKYGVDLTSPETAMRHMLAGAAGKGALMIAHHRTKVAEVELHYAEAPGAGPPLLLLHGIFGSSETYEALMPELAEMAHVYALDLRGHGLSDRAADGDAYRVADYSRDVQTFLRTVVSEPVVLAGHSLGGLVAAWTAAHAPDLVRALFLEDPPIYTALMPRFKDTIFYAFFNELRNVLRQHIASGASIDDLAQQIASWPVAEGVTLLDQVGEEGVRMQARQFHRFDIHALSSEIVETIWGVEDPDAVLMEVKCPAHLIAGQYDLGGAMDAEDVRRASAAIPDCTRTVLGTVGHGIHADRPGEYVNELRKFLTTL